MGEQNPTGAEPGRVRGTASERRDRSGAAWATGTARGLWADAFVTSGAGQLTGSGRYPVTVAWRQRRGAAMADDDLLPVVSFGNLMSEGLTLSRRGQHDKALGCFNDVRAPRSEGTEMPTGGRGLGRGRLGGFGSVQEGEEGGTRRDVSPGGGDPDGAVQGQGSACSCCEKQEKTLQ